MDVNYYAAQAEARNVLSELHAEKDIGGVTYFDLSRRFSTSSWWLQYS